jgi:lauroyl/myristoyl acyltransferase
MALRRHLRRAGFHLLKALARVLGRGGMARIRRVGSYFGEMHFKLLRGKRLRLQQQMAEALNRMDSDPDLRNWLREAYRVNDRAILEILAMYSGAVSLQDICQSCQVEDLDQLDQALAVGKGVVLLGMHMGNGVAMAAHLANRGYPVAVIYRESNKIPQHFFRDGIGSLGLEAIPAVPASVGVRRMLKALKENRILFILMDQASKRGGIEAMFLGKPVQMPPGPSELARRTGAAVVPALLEGVEPQWQFRMGPPVWLDADQPLATNVQFLTEIMQTQIEKRPQWWTWHQRRWSRQAFPANE